ncbi:MAG: electron transport complex subunit RsxE [Planctomycetes bacterium]|nr:electron transport complex subunit RsxE [Planctomycetota bacterium]
MSATARDDLIRGVWRENPVLVTTLGLCPTLAVTNTVANCVAMGLATFFVLVASCYLVALVAKWIPGEIRITAFVLIIATFVTVADMAIEALAPDVHKALGAFIALIVVNCIILGRQEAFASKNPVLNSVADAAGAGIGFMVTMLMMGTVREVIGNGTLLGHRVLPASYEPWVVMMLPPGGFLTLGTILLLIKWKKVRKPAVADAPAPAAAASGAVSGGSAA